MHHVRHDLHRSRCCSAGDPLVPTAARKGRRRRATEPLLLARASSSSSIRSSSLVAAHHPISSDAVALVRSTSSSSSSCSSGGGPSGRCRPATGIAAAAASAPPPPPDDDAGDNKKDAARACWKLLREFSAAEFRRQAAPWVDTPEKRARLRDALVTAYRLPAPPDSGYGWAGAASAAASAAAADAAAPPLPPPLLLPQGDVIVGVTASDARVAVRALREWCAALGLPYVQPEARLGGREGGGGGGGGKEVEGAAAAALTPAPAAAAHLAALPPGPVYVKYAPAGGVCYASPYSGPDRGVLLQLGQAPLLGHFPLGLHDRPK